MKATMLLLLAGGVLLGLGSAHAQTGVPEKYRDTVSRGLEFLAKQQCEDGHWEADGGKYPVTLTALAGMALLMEGSNLAQGKYSAHLHKAAVWLRDKSAARDGLIFSGHASETDRYMYGHGLATQFLAWAWGSGQYFGKRGGQEASGVQGGFQAPAWHGVQYILKTQSSLGGWYRTSTKEGHDFAEVPSTVIQLQALKMADHVGISIPDAALNDGRVYLETALAKRERKSPYRQAATAAALTRCYDVGGTKDNTWTTWCQYCRTEIPMGRAVEFGRDELTHYYYAQAVYFYHEWMTDLIAWKDYRAAMFDHLQSKQNKDGSWPHGNFDKDSQGEPLAVGPLYVTALWCTVLQLDESCHPAMRRKRGGK